MHYSRKITIVGPVVVDVITHRDGTCVRWPGGTATIAAVALPAATRLLGLELDVDLAVTIGTDSRGRYLRAFLRRASSAAHGLRLARSRETKVNHIFVNADGTWQFGRSIPANVKYMRKAVRAEGSDSLFIGALNSLVLSQPIETVALLRSTRSLARFITLSRGGLHVSQRVWELVGVNDWVFCNLEELSGALGRPVNGAIANATHELGWSQAVVTEGNAGCWLVTAESCRHFAAHQSPSRSTVGAGDVFASFFAGAILSGSQPEAATEFAMVAGATVAVTGSWMEAIRSIVASA